MLSKPISFIKERINRYFVISKHRTLNYFLFTLALIIISRLLMIAFFISKYGTLRDYIIFTTSTYDNNWFGSIITGGYVKEPNGHAAGDAANWAFFPLAPLMVKIFSFNCLLNYRVVGIILNTLFFALAITVAYRYVTDFHDSIKVVLIFTAIMVFGPFSFYFSSLYSESLFMLLTMLFLYHLRRENYILMGIFGAALSATRVTGVLMAFAVLVYVICKHVKEKRGNVIVFIKETLQNHRLILGVCLIPLGLFLYMLYLKNLTGDAFAFMHIQKAWGRHL